MPHSHIVPQTTPVTNSVLTSAVDGNTNALMVVPYEHHEIHSGSHFYFRDPIELDNGIAQVYLLTVPDTTKAPHLVFEVEAVAVTQVDLYEGADRTGTTAQTLWNNNRRSVTAATLVIHKGISAGSTDGTLMWSWKSGIAAGASVRAGGVAREDSELMLARNTKYLMRVTSSTNDNLINVVFRWYEHTSVI